jgi:hypothetical protein
MKPVALIKIYVNADQSYDFARLATIRSRMVGGPDCPSRMAITLEVVLKYVLT